MLPLVSLESFRHGMQKCKGKKSACHAQCLHAYMHKYGLQAHRSLGNYLVSMLVEVGSMYDAHQVFEKLLFTTECSWDSLINAYIKCGQSGDALTMCQRRQGKSLQLSGHTFVALVKVCAEMNDLELGCELHTQVASKGLLSRDPFVGSALVNMYAKCGSLAKAQEVFNALPVRDVVTWTALISAYVEQELGEKALDCFGEMQLAGISPNSFTFVCILKVCGSIRDLEKGSKIHAEAEKRGLLKTSPFVASAVIDMYAKCGMLGKAREVFDILPVRGVVSWTALIAGYAQQELGEEALKCFEQMRSEGVHPNAVTFASTLKACGSIGDANRGSIIHSEIAKKGLLKGDLVLGNALVDMHAKCGMLEKAQEIFEELLVRDIVSWNALISGYVQHEHGEIALHCFKQLQDQGFSPNTVTFSTCLKACGSTGAADIGTEIHSEIARKGLSNEDLVLGNALVDMYAKCGLLSKAEEVFDELPVQDTCSWNSLVTGYAQLGETEDVLCSFDFMKEQGKKPDHITSVNVLNACSHAGMVDKALTHFKFMIDDYSITPTLQHLTCMVDLLGRAGQLETAIASIMKMPFHPNIVLWHSVLSACRKWRDVKFGRQSLEQAWELNAEEAAALISMCNLYVEHAGGCKDVKSSRAKGNGELLTSLS